MAEKPSADTPTTPLPDRLPDALAAYYQRVLGGLEQAQRELQQVTQLEQQITALRQSATARVGAFESFEQHLIELLGLDPRTDRIEPDGRILRGQAPPLNGQGP